LKKKISLEELGRHTRLSPALLSKLERDLVMPTLPTLVRVALVLMSDSTRFHRHAARRRRRARRRLNLHPAVGAARVCGRRRRAVPRGLGHDRRARQRCPP